MIKLLITVSAVGIGFAFAAGAYVGWKTTLKVVESVDKDAKRARDAR